jgi:hypothetical protein
MEVHHRPAELQKGSRSRTRAGVVRVCGRSEEELSDHMPVTATYAAETEVCSVPGSCRGLVQYRQSTHKQKIQS